MVHWTKLSYQGGTPLQAEGSHPAPPKDSFLLKRAFLLGAGSGPPEVTLKLAKLSSCQKPWKDTSPTLHVPPLSWILPKHPQIPNHRMSKFPPAPCPPVTNIVTATRADISSAGPEAKSKARTSGLRINHPAMGSVVP